MNSLEDLQAEYRSALAGKVARIESLWLERKMTELRRALHTLAGSAGSFGLSDVSHAALEAETYLNACGEAPDAGQQAGLQQLLAAIYSRAAAARI